MTNNDNLLVIEGFKCYICSFSCIFFENQKIGRFLAPSYAQSV